MGETPDTVLEIADRAAFAYDVVYAVLCSQTSVMYRLFPAVDGIPAVCVRRTGIYRFQECAQDVLAVEYIVLDSTDKDPVLVDGVPVAHRYLAADIIDLSYMRLPRFYYPRQMRVFENSPDIPHAEAVALHPVLCSETV